jgi:hypothetical protein
VSFPYVQSKNRSHGKNTSWRVFRQWHNELWTPSSGSLVTSRTLFIFVVNFDPNGHGHRHTLWSAQLSELWVVFYGLRTVSSSYMMLQRDTRVLHVPTHFRLYATITNWRTFRCVQHTASSLKTEAVCPSDTLVQTHKHVWSYNPTAAYIRHGEMEDPVFRFVTVFELNESTVLSKDPPLEDGCLLSCSAV